MKWNNCLFSPINWCIHAVAQIYFILYKIGSEKIDHKNSGVKMQKKYFCHYNPIRYKGSGIPKAILYKMFLKWATFLWTPPKRMKYIQSRKLCKQVSFLCIRSHFQLWGGLYPSLYLEHLIVAFLLDTFFGILGIANFVLALAFKGLINLLFSITISTTLCKLSNECH